jgi:hypothetical protein
MKTWQLCCAAVLVAGSILYFGVEDSRMISRCESRGESVQYCRLQVLGR